MCLRGVNPDGSEGSGAPFFDLRVSFPHHGKRSRRFLVFFWKKNKSRNLDGLSKTERENLARELLDEGNRAVEKGRHEAALESFRLLIRLEPQDPDHRRRLADCHGKLGDKKAELEAREKAATLYAEAGFLLKGIAMCKLVLAIDPSHQKTQKQLAELHKLTSKQPPPAVSPPRLTNKEEEARKARALAEAQERVERVRLAREKAAAARKAQETAAVPGNAAPPAAAALDTTALDAAPFSAGPPPTSGTPLESVSLRNIMPRLSDTDLSPESIEDDDEIFIAPLEEEEDDNTEAGVESALRRVPLLSDLSQKSLVALIEQVSFRQLEEGEVLFEVGSAADAMYCVVEGEVAACLPGPFGRDLELARLGEGEFFGEIGLLSDQPRQATIVATRKTVLLLFARGVVSELEKTEPQFVKILLRFVRERLIASLIATNPLFAPFSGQEAEDLTKRFRFLEVKARKPLVRQGSPSGGVFILLSGGARVVRSQGGKTEELGRLGPGDIFGEMSLLSGENAIASVVISVQSYLLELPAQDFTELVMVHPALLSYVSSLALERQAKNEALLARSVASMGDRLPLT